MTSRRGKQYSDNPALRAAEEPALYRTQELETENLNPETPLKAMSAFERLSTDYATQGHTTGPHPMRLWRMQCSVNSKQCTDPQNPAYCTLNTAPCTLNPPLRAIDLATIPHGMHITCAGQVICRQRPGTAKGHCFISLEDETGIANLFVPRDTFHQYRLVMTTEQVLLCHGRMQVGEGNTHTLYTTSVEALPFPTDLDTASHDFH